MAKRVLVSRKVIDRDRGGLVRTTRRAMMRQAAPPPSPVPHAAKRARKQKAAGPPPKHIRVLGATLDADEREYILRKLDRRLKKFTSSIERVSVRLYDINGPKGGVDHACLIKVVLKGLPSVVVERRDATLRPAVDAAVDAVVRTVRRRVQRRRLKPLHQRSPLPAVAAS